MALPPLPVLQAPAGLPAVQSTSSLPDTEGQNDPFFGAYPSEAGLLASVPTMPTSTLLGQQQSSLLSLLSAQGVPPEVAQPGADMDASIQSAIAKISTANPELGKELAARLEGGEADQGGFFGSLLDTVGNVLSPVLSIGKKALEILSRPARIIPGLLVNDDDPWYEDIGQALSGESHDSWSDVLDQWGIDSGPLKGILGFTLDVATDPLTYLTFGTAGVGRKMVAETGARLVGTAIGREGIEQAAVQGGSMFGKLAGMDASEYATRMYDDLLKVRTPAGKGLDPHAAAGLASFGVAKYEQQIAANMLEASDYVHRIITTGGLKNLPKAIQLSTGRTLSRGEVFSILEEGKQIAQFSRSNWLAGKAAAGARGGVRFRFAIPFTDFRYISAPIPYSEGMSFAVFRRFFNGTSGMTNLLRNIDRGTEGVGWEDYRNWVEGGFKGALEKNPKLKSVLGTRGGNFGSMFYSWSDSIGQMTAHLSPHAKRLRGGGLVAGMGSDLEVLARGWRESLQSDGWTHTDPNGVVTDKTALTHTAARDLQGLGEDDHIEYVEAVFGRDVQDMGIEKWWQENRIAPLQEQRAQNLIDDDVYALKLAEYEAGMKRALDAEKLLTPAQRDIVWKFAENQRVISDVANLEGAAIGDVRMSLETLTRVRPEDVPKWNGMSRGDVRDVEFYAPSMDPIGTDLSERAVTGFRPSSTGDRRLGFGVYVEAAPAGGPLLSEGTAQATRAAIRLRNGKTLHVDRRGMDTHGRTATLDDSALLDELYEAAEKDARLGLEQAKSREPLLPGEAPLPVQDAAVQAKADEMVTEALKKRGYEGIVVHEADGAVRATVFDSSNVKVVDVEAPTAVYERGYVPRVLTQDAEAWLRGSLPETEYRRIIYGAPKLHHDIHRANPNLSFREAEQAWVDSLRAKNHQVPDGMKFFERDLLRVHEQYVHRVTEAIVGEVAGHNAGRMAYLTDLAPGLLGGAAGRTVYQWKTAVLDEKTLTQLPQRVQKALARTERSQQRLVVAQARAAQESQAAAVRIQAAIEGNLPPSSGFAGRAQAAANRLQVRTRVSGAELRKDLSKAISEGLVVSRKLKLAEQGSKKVKESAADLKLTMDSVTERINDLRTLVRQAEAPPVRGPGRYEPNPEVRDAAREFMRSTGRAYEPADDVYVEVVEARAKRIADAYEQMKHAPNDPKVQAAYQAFKDETLEQYDYLMSRGFVLEPYAGKGEPYKNSAEFVEDIRQNKHLYYLKTKTGETFDGPEDNPLLESAGRPARDSAGQEYDQTYNDIFRAVHDVFGHTKEGLQTGARGEENAWLQHARMFSAEARRAMTTETRGQNSWVNFGPNVRHADGTLPKRGDPDYKGLADRPFATQKTGLLPDEFSRLPASETARVREASARGTAAERTTELFERETAEELASQRRLERLMRRNSDAIEDTNKLIAQYRIDVAKPTPALVPVKNGYPAGWVQLQVKGMEDVAMPAYIAKEFQSFLDGLPAPSAISKKWREWTQVWKEWATFRFPGFHVRNHMGAWFNNTIGGVTADDYRLAMKLRKAYLGRKHVDEVIPDDMFDLYSLGRMFRGRKGKMTYDELATRISDMGVGSSNARATADVRSMPEAIEKEMRNAGKGGLPRKALEAYDRKVAHRLTESTENFHRFAGFVGGMRQTQGDMHGARAFVMLRQGDYTDLTAYEERVVKGLLPFYKWMRTNFPYQLHNLLENPGVPLTVGKAKEAAYFAQGLDPDEERAKQPEWMRNELALPIPKALAGVLNKVPGLKGIDAGDDYVSYMMLDLPMSDLMTGTREFISSFLPLVRPAFESYVAEKNLFSGAPLEGDLVPLGAWANLPIMKEALDMLVPGTIQDVNGKLMMDNRVQNLLSTIPVFSRFRNWVYGEESRINLRANALMSSLLGFGVRPLDQESMDAAETAFYFDQILPIINQMKDLGVTLPSTDDLRAIGLLTDDEDEQQLQAA